MTNPKDKRSNAKRRDEMAQKNACHEDDIMNGWDACLADLKHQLGLPEDCDLENIVLKMKKTLEKMAAQEVVKRSRETWWK